MKNALSSNLALNITLGRFFGLINGDLMYAFAPSALNKKSMKRTYEWISFNVISKGNTQNSSLPIKSQ